MYLFYFIVLNYFVVSGGNTVIFKFCKCIKFYIDDGVRVILLLGSFCLKIFLQGKRQVYTSPTDETSFVKMLQRRTGDDGGARSLVLPYYI